MPCSLGLVPYPGARQDTVRWLACVVPGKWPIELDVTPEPFAMVTKAWIADYRTTRGTQRVA